MKLRTGVAFRVLLETITRRSRLLRREIPAAAVARVHRAYRVGPFIYATSVALSAWNPLVGLMVCMSLWVLWTRLRYEPPHEVARRDIVSDSWHSRAEMRQDAERDASVERR